MKGLVCAIVVAAAWAAADAATLWEAYLANPTPSNAAKVTVMDYSPGAIPEGYGYWYPHLELLQAQIVKGDPESFRLAYRLRAQSDGGLLEDFTALLGRSVRPQPEQFLREVKRISPDHCGLGRMLLMPGGDFGHPDELRDEMRLRRQALASVKDPSLAVVRDECLEVLEQ